jgi:hypothetical protein
VRISKRQLRHMIREVMTGSPDATPGQAISTADDEKSGSSFSPEQKAAIGFMNNSMGPSPSADQLKGMGPELQSYAKDKDVDPEKMSNHLQQMLPATSDHPHFQYDAGSGAVGSTDGKKVYGENRLKITKRQLRRVIKEVRPDPRQLTFNQPEVDKVNQMAQTIDKVWGDFRQIHSIPEHWLDGGDYEKLEVMLFDASELLNNLVNDMKAKRI